MTSNGQGARIRLLRWNLSWRWTLAGLIGYIVANILYNLLPTVLLYPLADEDIWLIQPWRIAALTCVYYTPISVAQWLVLRRYVQRAWWWLIVTLTSVIVLYPGSIWMLWTLHQWDLASDVWFLGLGGGSVYLIAQWVVMLRWARNPRIWALLFVATTLGWIGILSVNTSFNADLAVLASSTGLREQLLAIVFWGLYQLTLGGVLVTILQIDSPNEVIQTTFS